MKIILSSVDGELADAWERHCGDLPDVTVHRGSILDLSVDAVLSSVRQTVLVSRMVATSADVFK